MATLKKYDLEGREVGEVLVDESLINVTVNSQLIKDYIVAIRANARQWSACTKTRSEVSHSNKKPHKQKGTGSARQGSLAAPHYRGGGRAHGPKPKFDQHIKINRKERRLAIRSLISEKIQENKIFLIDNIKVDAPKTKKVMNFIQNVGLKGKTLFLGQGAFETIEDGDEKISVSVKADLHKNFALSVRNHPKASFSLVSNISGYDLLKAKDIVMTEEALHELNEWLKTKS